MDDIDDTMIFPQLFHGRDEADSMEQQLPKKNQLNIISKPFQNLNLLHEHRMMVTEEQKDVWRTCYQHGMVSKEPHNKIPHGSHVFNLPDPKNEVPEVPKWCRKPQKPNNKTHLSQGTSRIPHVSKVRKPQPVIGYRVPMTTEEELNSWRKFQERAERDNWPARRVWVPDAEEVLDHGEPIVPLLARFAVDTYNAICLKAGVSDGIRMTSILEFKYIKKGEIYANYITIEAACPYTGINCKFEALVQTLCSDGRKTLVGFHRDWGWHPFAKEQKKKKKKKKKEEEEEECEEVARWKELKEQRVKELKVPPSGSGLEVDNMLGRYFYFNPLKEFKNIYY